ncbi:hypothetical protein HC928_02205 [bacterium]|nr:hypothetical protein [bacterium]
MQFTNELSCQVLEKAPGLHINIHSLPFAWGQDLPSALSELFQHMKRQRSMQPAIMPLAGLGVTMMCSSTGLPAVGFASVGGDKRPASAEVLAKLNAAEAANRELHNMFLRDDQDGHEFPADLDLLGRQRGDYSLIAIVHADGNGIGKKIMTIGQEPQNKADSRTYIQEMRAFSQNLEHASQAALWRTLRPLFQLRQVPVFTGDIANPFYKPEESQTVYLPFRPLVFGGDDVTFVCDGRLGLELAVEYLKAFEEETARSLGERFTARAGVAIVKSHFPFARAYELAEELGKSAKRYAPDHSGLDWHLSTSGLFGSLEDIRGREYRVPEGNLTLRPLALAGEAPHSWETMRTIVNKFLCKTWQAKRNKAKALREKLRGGRASVQQFEQLYGQELPEVSGFKAGWHDESDENGQPTRVCGYFDALELMDSYLPLYATEEPTDAV